MLRATLQDVLNDLGDAQRAMRRKMRVYPALLGAKLRRKTEVDAAEKRRWQDAQENAIVSVNGKDLSSEDEIADAPENPAGDRKNAA